MSDLLTILCGARTKLTNPEKWCQHRFRNDHGALCLVGALGEAAREAFPDNHVKRMSLTLSANHMLSTLVKHESLTVFNDDPDTTHGHVLHLLDKGIEYAA